MFVAFLLIILISFAFQLRPIVRLFRKNRAAIKQLEFLKNLSDDSSSVFSTVTHYDFQLRKINTLLSIQEVQSILKLNIHASELFSPDTINMIDDNHILLTGRFHSSEVLVKRNGLLDDNDNMSFPVIYTCEILFKKVTTNKLECWGIFPENKIHDFLYADLFYHIEAALRKEH